MAGPNLYLLASRIPPKVMLLVVLTLAIGASVLVQSELNNKEALLRQEKVRASKKEMSSVLVASRDIAEDSLITADAIEIRSIESSKIPINSLNSQGAAVGMKARVPIAAGDCILSQSVKMQEQAKGFEAKIRPGYRAITFPVDASTGVAGFITPDSHVDILSQTGSGAESAAIPILSDVQVVAVGQTYRKQPGVEEAQPSSCVTVSVNPHDAGKLINAMATGKLYCLMRNQNDHSPLAVKDVSRIIPAGKPHTDVELTSIPSLPPSTISLPPPVVPGRDQELSAEQRMHNIDTWAASKKDAVQFPEK